jgi:hypothetical protein
MCGWINMCYKTSQANTLFACRINKWFVAVGSVKRREVALKHNIIVI